MLVSSLRKSIDVLEGLSILYLNIGERSKFVVIQNEFGTIRYIAMPIICLRLAKLGNKLLFDFDARKRGDIATIKGFMHRVFLVVNSLQAPYFIRLVIQGLGYKFRQLMDNSVLKLELKLGLSHLSYLVIPSDRVKLFFSKNKLIVTGYDRTAVGNFANKVRELKIPDVYKGKGFWYANEQRSFKEIKKT